MQTTEKTSVISHSFLGVNPINTIEEGVRFGHYSRWTNETVPLKPVQGPKNLHLVCFNRIIGEMEYVELLRAEEKQPCKNGLQYLLGLMVQLSEDEMPIGLRNKYLVAAEPGHNYTVYAGERSYRYLLHVRLINGYRTLHHLSADGGWSCCWTFLAEDIVL